MNKFVSKTWGYEILHENNDDYCMKTLHVIPGQWSSVHFHYNKLESWLITNGSLKVRYYKCLSSDGGRFNKFKPGDDPKNLLKDWESLPIITEILSTGQVFTIPRFVPHTFTSHGLLPCTLIECSTHHEDSDSYRIIEAQDEYTRNR